MSERIGGTGLLASLLLVGVAGLAEMSGPGDRTGLVTTFLGAAVVAFAVGMFGVRQRITGVGVRVPLLVASAVASVAVIAGTVLPVSGVVLAIPVIVVAVVAIAPGGWRLGDAAIFALLAGMATGAGYVLAATGTRPLWSSACPRSSPWPAPGSGSAWPWCGDQGRCT